MTLLLSNEDVEQVLDMAGALAALEPVYRDLPDGRAVNRPQSQTYLPGPLPASSYCLKTVEGGAQALGVMAIRLTSDVLRAETLDGVERRVKVPTAPGGRYLGLVLLFSLEHGGLLAIMPDGIIQQLRVGASSALAAAAMARPEAHTLGLIGAGPQAQAPLLRLARGRGVPGARYPELADVLAGDAPARATPDEITLFMNNFGIGIQFATLGAVAYEGARARGLGRDLPDDWFLETIRP